jgi:hypothetical protein
MILITLTRYDHQHKKDSGGKHPCKECERTAGAQKN